MKKGKRIRGILIFSLVIALSLWFMYYFADLNSFSPEMAMYRKEAARLVGPSQVIAADTVEYTGYDCFLLGETDYGYCLFEYLDSPTGWDSGCLTYIGKDEGRVCFAPNRNMFVDFGAVLPVLAIPEEPGAVTARLTLETKSDRDLIYAELYTVETELRQGVYFLFEVETKDMYIDVRRFWANRFQNDNSSYAYISGTATLELLNHQGALIKTVVMEFSATK